ncbi:MAG: sulfur oxidation c-type cytochrome SoxX [Geminicoccaceae bacterium]
MNISRCVKLSGLALAITVAGGLAGAGQAEEPVAFEIVDETSIPASLTGAPGNADKGRETFTNRKLGNCLGCHAVGELAAEPFHGEVGPPLDGVADRYEEGEIRLQVVNAKVANPDTIMPGFYVSDGLHRVAENFHGKTILSADQVEDIVAYLMTLRES